ncbi:unnamed protein product [Ceratitis capitata]|uniref:(Mediterranean fruit fly) hypothetical protein n=1 Tax=Ceratitis capitata TaxID=7213 RepID=A0A811V267_CERCA|nr:unnamed protein product [Ceratitis capitata]
MNFCLNAKEMNLFIISFFPKCFVILVHESGIKPPQACMPVHRTCATHDIPPATSNNLLPNIYRQRQMTCTCKLIQTLTNVHTHLYLHPASLTLDATNSSY